MVWKKGKQANTGVPISALLVPMSLERFLRLLRIGSLCFIYAGSNDVFDLFTAHFSY
jgi:hypothetical protein